MELAAATIGMRIAVLGSAFLPRQGRLVIASNHPTGLADGVVLWRVLSPIRRDVRMLANADAIRMAPGLADVFIPVPWRESERNAASRRSLVAELGRTLRGEGTVVFFPSGRLAYCTSGGLAERPWQPTVITVARKFRAPILPLHIRARNSPLFYGLSRLSDELRDITLFHELLNKGATRFDITLGRAIDPRSLPDDPVAAAGRLQRYVEHELPRATAREPQLTPPRHADAVSGVDPVQPMRTNAATEGTPAALSTCSMYGPGGTTAGVGFIVQFKTPFCSVNATRWKRWSMLMQCVTAA